MEGGGEVVGLLSFCSFVFSVIAAVLAIDLYALLRTGRSGATWRVLIIASVMFALMHALRLAELLNFGLFRLTHLSEIVELMFVMALAYAFYLQRKTFSAHDRSAKPRASPRAAPPDNRPEDAPAGQSAEQILDAQQLDPEDLPVNRARTESLPLKLEPEDEDLEEVEAASEWARLSGQADSAGTKRAHRAGE